MCGACGGPEPRDWAGALTASLPARIAVATAITRLAALPGLKVTARPGGWLVSTPTGTRNACVGLTALVAAVRPAVGGAGPGVLDGRVGRASGPLARPGPDLRSGVRLLVRPGLSTADRAPTGRWTVPSQDAALAALAHLAGPPMSLRHYLIEVSGVAAPWGAAEGHRAWSDDPHDASDLVVAAEWARQSGAFDRTPFAARCPLDPTHVLDLEIRAGHVVRAVHQGLRIAS